MKKTMITALLCALAATMTAQERDKYWVQADSLCAKLLTMDTHNHIDVPMTKEKLPGPRVDLRTAMSKAGMSAVGMTFAVDYVQPLAEGQVRLRRLSAATSAACSVRLQINRPVRLLSTAFAADGYYTAYNMGMTIGIAKDLFKV